MRDGREQPGEPGFEPSGFFALRTPLLPFDEVLAFGAGLSAPAALDGGSNLDAALTADREMLRERLHSIVNRPEVRDALFLGSPDLEAGIGVWAADPDGRRGRAIERALVRYVLRMAGRATPFGLFAGCSVGDIAERTRLVTTGRADYQRHSRLDMEYLSAVAESIINDPQVRAGLTYRPNSSLYCVAGRVRYVEARWDGTKRSHHLVTVTQAAPLAHALARAADGATPSEITEALVEHGLGQSEAQTYVGRLVDSQILVADHGPAVTGPEPLRTLVAELREAASKAGATTLDAVGHELAAIDTGGIGASPERYRVLARSLEELPVRFELSRLFQVDMVKPAPSATVGGELMRELVRGVRLLHRLARGPSRTQAEKGGGEYEGGRRPMDADLERFVDAFLDRYESREVRLVEALDGELGVGFGPAKDATPLLAGLAFPGQPSTSVSWAKRERWLLRTLAEATASGAREIALSERDIEDIAEGEPPPLPDAFSVMATVAATSQEDLDRGRFRVLLGGIWGPSGAPLLGRFCHADPALSERVGRHLRAEEALDSDALYAEIVHLPEGRIGNILLRPVLRSHEIPYLGRSGAPRDRQIPVTDLMVSVRGGRIVLRSARLDRGVVPRLTTAHNYSWRAVPTYRFLCALQTQGSVGGLRWNWGALDGAPFLPRVIHGRLVLSRARWRVGPDELRRLGQAQGSELFAAVHRWQAERGLPRLCTLADADNTLPIDFDNVMSVEAFVHLVRRRDEATIEELFPAPDDMCAYGPEGRFVHELVVPFVRTASVAAAVRKPVPGAGVVRTFPPGSEWLYAKLYSAPSIADELLRDLRPLVVGALEEGRADRWFFIRYADPHPHLRLRLHGDPEVLTRQVLPALQEAVQRWVEDGRVWRFELGTYEREVERYGGPAAMLLCEEVFHADSEATSRIVLRLSRGDRGSDQRWRLTVRGMDMLLADLGFDVDGKLGILRQVRAAFAKEHRVSGTIEGELGQRFRKDRAELERLLDPVHDAGSPLEPGFELLRSRSARLAPVCSQLRGLSEAGQLCTPLTDVAGSLLHMHANRLLRSARRAQELVVYGFLQRLYQAQAARDRGSGHQ